jgi:hypothetical protein
MTNSKVLIDIDGTVSELTGNELIAYQNQIKKNLEDVAIKEAELLKKEADKTALLAKLGITSDEAKLLLS